MSGSLESLIQIISNSQKNETDKKNRIKELEDQLSEKEKLFDQKSQEIFVLNKIIDDQKNDMFHTNLQKKRTKNQNQRSRDRIKKLNDGHIQKIKKMGNTDIYCSICLETEHATDIDIVKLSCSHTMHLHCYIDHISSSDKTTNCPMCRKNYKLPNIVNVLQKIKDKLNVAEETELYLRQELSREMRINQRNRPVNQEESMGEEDYDDIIVSESVPNDENAELPELVPVDVPGISVTIDLPAGTTDRERDIYSRFMSNMTNILNDNNNNNISLSLGDMLNRFPDIISNIEPSLEHSDTMNQIREFANQVNSLQSSDSSTPLIPPEPPQGSNQIGSSRIPTSFNFNSMTPDLISMARRYYTPNNTQNNTRMNSPTRIAPEIRHRLQRTVSQIVLPQTLPDINDEEPNEPENNEEEEKAEEEEKIDN